MATIAVNNEVITVIVIFSVEGKSEYWEGVAENEHHLYEVVLTMPND